MDRAEIVSRFNRLYLGDSLLQRVEVKIGEAECRLTFNSGNVLKAEGASIFDPEAKFAPAMLRLRGLRSISGEGATRYQLNSTVVDFGAATGRNPDYIEFYLVLTGGTDPDAFMAKVTFEAKDFDFGPPKV